ncbi:MAG: NIPSNAP family protein [Verrucomicrobiota bacterium]|jgi:hypothetical protein|nr:NIPSNAP family protein [Verrucomicrobiota bacterium]
MKRRGFLFLAGAAIGLAGAGCTSTGAGTCGKTVSGKADVRELIEVKTYVCSSVAKRDALIKVFDEALIPALNRQGVRKVGVFWSNGEVNDGNADYEKSVFVVIPRPDAASVLDGDQRLLADPEYVKAAAALFSAPMAEPLYDSSSSTLLRGFATCPKVNKVTDSPDRVLQLRTYNSYTTERNLRKISMFEQGGEIGTFRACGMEPVFFGQALAGDRLPNLTYLLGFADKAAKDAGWAKFRTHPDWLKLKADPQYKDTANKITNIVLRPSKGSQL